MVNEEHAQRKLPPEEYKPCYYVSRYNANHLSRQGVEPQLVISRVGWGSREMECGCNISGLKRLLPTINREMDNSRMRHSPRCHGMVELNDHPGVEEPAQVIKASREYRCTLLMESLSSGSTVKDGKSKCLAVHFSGTAIRIAYNGVSMKEGAPDDRSKGQIRG